MWLRHKGEKVKGQLAEGGGILSHTHAQLVRQAPTKWSSFDPVSTWLLKNCIHLLAPFMISIINRSLLTDVSHRRLRTHKRPRLRKSRGLDQNEACNCTEQSLIFHSCPKYWTKLSVGIDRREVAFVPSGCL